MKGFTRRHPVLLLVCCATLVLAAFPRLIAALKEGEPRKQAPRAGMLLVARPGQVSRAFDETVVLLLEAREERTWGLVLNRVRTVDGEPLPPGVDRWGGPVSGHTVTLAREDAAPPGAHRVLPGLAWYEGTREGHGALTFSGVSSWAPGQLEEEIARGSWWLVEGSAGAVFTAPGNVWAEHAARHL